MIETVMIEGLTLASVIWRKMRRQPAGYIERVLGVNPGLSANEIIPVGTAITFPLDNIEQKTTATGVVRLWD